MLFVARFFLAFLRVGCEKMRKMTLPFLKNSSFERKKEEEFMDRSKKNSAKTLSTEIVSDVLNNRFTFI